jgi:hypothetical protein
METGATPILCARDARLRVGHGMIPVFDGVSQAAARTDGEIGEHRKPRVAVADDERAFARPQSATIDLVLVRGAPVVSGRQGNFRFGFGFWRAGLGSSFGRAGGFYCLRICDGRRHARSLADGANLSNREFVGAATPRPRREFRCAHWKMRWGRRIHPAAAWRRRYFPQHFLNFFPLPQGQGSLRPIFGGAM